MNCHPHACRGPSHAITRGCRRQRAINSHPPYTHDHSGYCNWQPGDVILHVPGARHINVSRIVAAGLSGDLSVAWMQRQGYSINSEVHPGCQTCAEMGIHPSSVGSGMQHAIRTSGARYVQKWDSYLPSYERYLGKYVGHQPLFLELGVQSVAASPMSPQSRACGQTAPVPCRVPVPACPRSLLAAAFCHMPPHRWWQPVTVPPVLW